MKVNCPRNSLTLLWFAFFTLSFTLASAGIPGVAGTDYYTDRFVISIDENIDLAPADFSQGASSAGIASIDGLVRSHRVNAIAPFYPARVKHEILRKVVERMFIVTLEDGSDLESAIEAFGRDYHIEFAEPYYIHHCDYVPNDPMISSWYQLWRIETYTAWDYIRGDSTSRPVLGIVDSGVYYDHPDLEPNMWINSAEDLDSNGVFTDADINGIDDDLNDYVDDVVGYDLTMHDPIPFEPIPWHGTHVAGCATMACDNGYGGAATGWAARIMAVKCAPDSDPNSITHGFQGITYSADNGCKVINLSWGRGGGPSQGEQNIITAAYNLGAVVVAAAGNESSPYRHYPAAYAHVVSVAATDENDHIAYFSNYGDSVDICAPGVGVFSTWAHSSFSALDGTSMASPVTAGVVCLLRAADPAMSVDSVVLRLLSGADNIDSLNPGYEGMLGAGRVNAANSIGRGFFPRFNLSDLNITLTQDDGDGLLNPSERFNLIVNIANIWEDAPDVIGTLRADGQFTLHDSVANFGTIFGHGGSGNNASNPFDIAVNSNAEIGSHQFTLALATSSNFQITLTFDIAVTLEQAGFPGNIPANIESSPLILNIDADNTREILISASDRKYYSFESDGSITPGWPQEVSQDPLGGAAVGDIDNDQDLDIVGMARDGNIYAWNTGGAILPGFPRACGSMMFSTPVLGDLNGDSNLEIVVGGFISKRIYVIKSDGADYAGWPFQVSGNLYGSAALADIDEDGLPEIVFAAYDSTLHVLNIDQTYVAGFPVHFSGQVKTAPCVADIDGDGHLNIIIGTSTGRVYAFGHDGAVLPGWPVTLGSSVFSPPSLADMDNDGRLEVLVGCNDWRMYVFNSDGQPQNGFPVTTGAAVTSSPVVGDIDGDGRSEIVFGSSDGLIYAVDYRGQNLANFPIHPVASGQITGSAGLADLDGDGDCEIAIGVKTSGNNLEVLDYKAHYTSDQFPWPFLGKDYHRTSFYGPFQTGVGESERLPGSFDLAQNYPNPFNATTVIGFALPKSDNVNLSIYDLLGRRITTLFSGNLSAGEYSFSWDGRNERGIITASGVYFYKLGASEAVSIKRMTLIK